MHGVLVLLLTRTQVPARSPLAFARIVRPSLPPEVGAMTMEVRDMDEPRVGCTPPFSIEGTMTASQAVLESVGGFSPLRVR